MEKQQLHQVEAASMVANARASAESALIPPKVKISCKKHLEREARRSKSHTLVSKMRGGLL